METVKIKEVKKNSRDWYEITLDGDDRVLATKDQNLADVAQAASGGTAEVEINSTQNGNFTNHYVNSINGVREAKTARNTVKAAAAPRGKSPEVQADIAKQWSIGRAVELLMASDVDFSFPLSDVFLTALKEQAQTLLDARKDLKV